MQIAVTFWDAGSCRPLILKQAKKVVPIPTSAGDLLRDRRERPIEFAVILKALLHHHNANDCALVIPLKNRSRHWKSPVVVGLDRIRCSSLLRRSICRLENTCRRANAKVCLVNDFLGATLSTLGKATL